jgi:cell division protein FtsQ
VTTTPIRPATVTPGESGPTRKRRGLLIAALVVVVLAAFGTWLIAFSSAFGVGTVQVHGTHELTAAQVRTAADIADGTPLVRVDTADITRRVERLPDVASAQVSTSFPSTVSIEVVERQAVAYVRSHGQVMLVDRTGARYRSIGSTPAGLPRLVLASGAASAPSRAAVATVAASLPAVLRQRVASIQAQDPDAITLVLRGGTIVRWGSASRNAEKAQILPALLHRDATQIDITDPDLPVTR